MGRPKGYSPGQTRAITHRIGEWAWSTDNLHKRIVKTTADSCWDWTGSQNPQGNIFGAYKNGRPQMTQSNRLLQMEILGESIQGQDVRMSCGNRHCSNPNHFQLTLPGSKIKTKTAKPVIKTWQSVPIMLTISEHILALLEEDTRTLLKQMTKDFADSSGIDREFEYRWITMTEENHLLAKIKYPDTIKYMTERQR